MRKPEKSVAKVEPLTLQELDQVSGGSEWHDAQGNSGWSYDLPGISMHGYNHANGDSGTGVTAGGVTISHNSSYTLHT
jgi:hypothetical protein